jgi:hypothetical protein
MRTRTLTAYVSPFFLIAAGFVAGPRTAKPDTSAAPRQEWVTTCGASPVAPAATDQGFNNQTLRLIVHTSVGGNGARVRLSNVFGSRPLIIGAANIGLRGSGADLVAGSNRAFEGVKSVTIPAGRLAVSDPAHPMRFLPAYDSGDHLHPSDAGYQAMADAIDLSLFR